MQYIFLLISLSAIFCGPPSDLVDPFQYEYFKIPYNKTMYSGYLEPEDIPDHHFHYIFYPNDKSDLPVILWLNGGPGCSSLTGAMIENGPFVFIGGTPIFEENKYSWGKFAHMLYVETPVGVGFSYKNDGNTTTSDDVTAQNNYYMLLAFYRKFPEYKNNELYIAGESYAGTYIPTLVNKIIDNSQSNIRIRGMMIGNGCTDASECTKEAKYFPYYKFQFLANHNFISQKLEEYIEIHKAKCQFNKEQFCQDLYQDILTETNLDGTYEYNPYNIYGTCFQPPVETPQGERIPYAKNKFDPFDIIQGHIPPCSDAVGLYHYLRDDEFRKYLNIHPQSDQWAKCQSLNYTKDPRATYHLYPKIMAKGIKILKFSGDVDGVVPITGTIYWIEKLQKELNLPTIQQWRPWFKSNKQNAGNLWEIDGLLFVSVRNAGHMVPADQKEAAFIMAHNFIFDVPFSEE
ncbi:unnamed protein product (macronuclear) [Paramecium tetraurelia]|uniref:Carboxypeptidase n=1 Tax=Paramecium tetraurelia TaxID=5888 RepID=A0C000_PARTE|nr:uncharacterized protein GSPATT00005970001 [Paramecium tetraurelia]CAK64117.1 unnamed protein product [Paramecium tetraurelia]|eukprot:XP_001431515.1 hypothetical protein (macronuclear) [Paramecium tetraurelia strain d4-2]